VAASRRILNIKRRGVANMTGDGITVMCRGGAVSGEKLGIAGGVARGVITAATSS